MTIPALFVCPFCGNVSLTVRLVFPPPADLTPHPSPDITKRAYSVIRQACACDPVYRIDYSVDEDGLIEESEFYVQSNLFSVNPGR
ncbi:MAG: hypothetical protein HC883_03940 [Bdellovibrionaceae bacterium]|nr:hypothetical protein [Pseudobdellovibrionaceae bacterium]